jgi:hypothetical protein
MIIDFRLSESRSAKLAPFFLRGSDAVIFPAISSLAFWQRAWQRDEDHSEALPLRACTGWNAYYVYGNILSEVPSELSPDA